MIQKKTELKPTKAIRRSNREALLRILAGSLPTSHPDAHPLRAYLESQGIKSEDIPEGIRFHPSLPLCQEWRVLENYPAMLAEVKDQEGNTVSLHRTFLLEDGKKAAFDDPRQLMFPISSEDGCAIRLFEPAPILVVTERIEDALSAYLDTGLPAWATIDGDGMAGVLFPSIVKMVIIATDGKKWKGDLDAAIALSGRLLFEEGRDIGHGIPDDLESCLLELREGGDGTECEDLDEALNFCRMVKRSRKNTGASSVSGS